MMWMDFERGSTFFHWEFQIIMTLLFSGCAILHVCGSLLRCHPAVGFVPTNRALRLQIDTREDGDLGPLPGPVSTWTPLPSGSWCVCLSLLRIPVIEFRTHPIPA